MNRLQAHPCRYCRQAQAHPRKTEIRQGNEIITECKWICQSCGAVSQTAIVGRKKIDK